MRLSKSMSVGAGLGFIFSFVFTILAVLQFDQESNPETSVGELVAYSLLVGMPVLVVMGTFAGWLWDIFIKGKK